MRDHSARIPIRQPGGRGDGTRAADGGWPPASGARSAAMLLGCGPRRPEVAALAMGAVRARSRRGDGRRMARMRPSCLTGRFAFGISDRASSRALRVLGAAGRVGCDGQEQGEYQPGVAALQVAQHVARLAAKYHDETAAGGRRHRFFGGGYPVITQQEPAGQESVGMVGI